VTFFELIADNAENLILKHRDAQMAAFERISCCQLVLQIQTHELAKLLTAVQDHSDKNGDETTEKMNRR